MDAHAPAHPDRDRLLELIVELAVVHGQVTLSSGQEADWYIDLRRVTLHHEAAPLVGRVMRQLTGDLRYDVVGGLTLGADPVATAMLHAASDGAGFLDACVVRKQGKAHGLQRRIEGVSPKVLTQVLRALERDGLVTREVHAEVPPRVEYTLTPLGGTLVQAVAGLDAWARAHIDEVERSRAAYDARA